jgi:hypothetical protein
VTPPDRRYLLSIKPFDVPERLKGAPVSVEIIPEHGNAQRTVLTLSDAVSLETVDNPGHYLVRATLPSGRLIADRATIPDETDGAAVGEAVLDFGEHDPTHDVQDARRSSRPKFRSALSSFGSAVRGFLPKDDTFYSLFSPSSARDVGRLRPGERKFEWGTFEGWKADTAGMGVRRGGSGVIDLDGRIIAPLTNYSGQQLLIKAAPPGGHEDVLVAWVDDDSRKPGMITSDPDGAMYRSGAPCRVLRDHAEPITAGLFSYLRVGALEQAKSGVSVLTEMMGSKGAEERIGPDAATMAAYVLHRFRRPGAARIIERLASKFPDLADLHVIQGVLRISEGKAETAAEHFNAALDRGVPCYTEGVRLMRDGLNFLTDLYPTDKSIHTNARRANSLASAANFNSEVTCLRLGPDITADFT